MPLDTGVIDVRGSGGVVMTRTSPAERRLSRLRLFLSALCGADARILAKARVDGTEMTRRGTGHVRRADEVFLIVLNHGDDSSIEEPTAAAELVIMLWPTQLTGIAEGTVLRGGLAFTELALALAGVLLTSRAITSKHETGFSGEAADSGAIRDEAAVGCHDRLR
jgi:hypothetical protein